MTAGLGFFQNMYNQDGLTKAIYHQVNDTLDPFYRFLNNAIQTANKKRTSAVVKWKKVEQKYKIEVRRNNTEIRFKSNDDWWLVEGDFTDEEFRSMEDFIFRNPSGSKILRRITNKRNNNQNIFVQVEDEDIEGHRVEGKIEFANDDLNSKKVHLIKKEDEPRTYELVDGTKVNYISCRYDESINRWKSVLDIEWSSKDIPDQMKINGIIRDIEVQSAFPRFLNGTNITLQQERGNEYSCDTKLVQNATFYDHRNNDVEYRVTSISESSSKQKWIELILPDTKDIASDLLIDPRTLFFDESVKEIWEQKHFQKRGKLRIRRSRRDDFQLCVDRFPTSDSVYLPINVRNLKLQQKAIRQLQNKPLPDHRPLLQLCEKPEKVRWRRADQQQLDEKDYLFLDNPNFDGTLEQRDFVNKALNTPDIALLEGPPGSGKTRVICELTYQLLKQGKRVLVCSTTNVAVDNVLERLLEHPDAQTFVSAVRLGREERIDIKLRDRQLDDQVEKLIAFWKERQMFEGVQNIEDIAERSILMQSNVVCATTMGVSNYPLLDDVDRHIPGDDSGRLCDKTHFDVVILDEASKTTISEFLVPALLGKKWIVVGDVHQLPPFNDREEIVANIENIATFSDDKNSITVEHQRALFLYWFFFQKHFDKRDRNLQGIQRENILLHEQASVLNALLEKVLSKSERHDFIGVGEMKYVKSLSLKKIQRGNALQLSQAQFICLSKNTEKEHISKVPANYYPTSKIENTSWNYQHAYFLQQNQKDKMARELLSTLSEKSWAGEIAWRLIRLQELHRSSRQRTLEQYRNDIKILIEKAPSSVEKDLLLIRDVGLPSIIEVLQKGLGRKKQRPSVLNAGFFNLEYLEGAQCNQDKINSIGNHWTSRFQSLSYQHRMHPDISSLPREMIYENKSLHNSSYVQKRNQGWTFQPYKQKDRRLWVHSDQQEQSGINRKEIDNMMKVIKDFKNWAQCNQKNDGYWEIACLSFYVKQMQEIEEKLEKVCDEWRGNRGKIFYENNRKKIIAEIVCGTVDRFQGREADMVLLSMRNNNRIGFLDSTHRLNVAITRAREQLCIFGNQKYFGGQRCTSEELKKLATTTNVYTPKK